MPVRERECVDVWGVCAKKLSAEKVKEKRGKAKRVKGVAMDTNTATRKYWWLGGQIMRPRERTVDVEQQTSHAAHTSLLPFVTRLQRCTHRSLTSVYKTPICSEQ